MPRRNDVPDWRALPHQVLLALDAWLEHEGGELTHKGWFTAGRGRDPVGLMERSSGQDQRNLIAKFYRPPIQLKVDKVKDAGKSAKTFPHLARPYGEPVALGGWWLVFQDVARGDLGTVRPLLEPVLNGDPDAAAYCKDIIGSIVQDWNSGDGVDPPQRRSVPVEHFMRAILGERMDPNGPIQRWASGANVPGSGHPETVTQPGWGRILPNPFMLLNNRAYSRLPLDSVVTGRAHGDLSGRNILLPMGPHPRPEEYILIDLDRFDPGAPLARDPMHLLVALAMDLLQRDHFDASARRDLIEVIVDPDVRTGSGIGQRFSRISAAIHEGPAGWARSSGHGKEWREQTVLALVAAALMHVGRKFFADDDREWCFHLAAAATARYQTLTTRDDAFAPRRQAVRTTTPQTSSPPGRGVDPGEPMDTARLVVLHAPDGDGFVTMLTDRLATMPIDARPQGAGVAEANEVARADIVAVVVTTDLLASQAHRQTVELAARRELPVLWLRVHPVDGQPELSEDDGCYDFRAAGRAQWEELIAHLRWIGSPSYLISLYGRRLRRLNEGFRDAEGTARERINQECELLEKRLEAQTARRTNRGHPSTTRAVPTTGRAPAPSSRENGLRCYGQPLPAPPDEPLDRLNETDQLIALLESGHGPVALIGPDGFGKTAMISRLRRRIRDDRGVLPIDGFVYLPARGPYPINAVTVLSAIAEVALDSDQVRRVHADVRSSALPWPQKVRQVLSAITEGTRVLLVLDDVQDLVDGDGRFVDRQLIDTLTMALEQAEQKLQLLMVTTQVVVEPVPNVTSLPLNHGLDEDHAWDLLCAMDHPDELLDLAPHQGVATDLTALTAGHPRVLELVVALLHGDPTLTLPRLVEQLKREGLTGPSLLPSLLERALGGLDRTEQRVLQALAVLGQPVEPTAVDAVLARYLPGQVNEPTLNELVRRRLIRRDGRRFALPRDPDGTCLLDGLDLGVPSDRTREPRPLTQRALYGLAAEHFAASAPQVLGEEDVLRRLAEVEMRLAGGEREKALEVMNLLDNSSWSSWLANLRDRVPQEDDYLDVHNLASKAAARLRQDYADGAIRDLKDAIEICRRPHHRLRQSSCDVAIQLGDAHLHDGDCVQAAAWYRYALSEVKKDWHLEIGRARAGLLRCHYEWGKFEEALNDYERAKEALGHSDEPGAARSSLGLELSLGMVYASRGDLLEARQVLRLGQHAAEERKQIRLVGAFVGQRAVICLDTGEPDKAIEIATEAVNLGARTNNVPLCREAATVLAQAHLSRGADTDSLMAAQAAADNAVRLSQSNRAGVAFAVQGIALLRLRKTAPARAAFSLAHDRAERLWRADRGNFEVADLLGLASCGLAICGERERFREAEEAFVRAREIARTQTVVLRVQRLFRQLAPTLDARTEPVLAAASGPYPDSYP
ncbi:AAA family ATPase [Acrocarpospora macrocephala]